MEGYSLREKGTRSGREEQIQFLRFLAFLNIYIAHAEVWLFFPYRASHCAASAVSFFFILSGGLTGYAGVGKERKPTLHDVGRYMWKKIVKVYPLYFATMLIAALPSYLPQLLAGCNFEAAWPTLKQLMKHFLMIQSWFPEGYFEFNGVGWFISSIMFLYLLNLPAIYVLNRINQYSKRYFLFAGILGAILFVTVAYCYLTQPLDMLFLQYILPPARAGEYLCGMILGFVIRTAKPKVTQKKAAEWIFTVLEVAVLVYWYYSLSRPGNYWRNRIVSWLIPNMMLFSVFLVGKGWISNFFHWKPLVWLGNITFECFLIHNVVIIWFLLSHQGMELIEPFGSAFAFCLCLAVTLILAALVYRPEKR